MNINFASVYHEAKSKYAYAFDRNTLHIRLRTGKDEVENVRLIYGDPFDWGPKEHKNKDKDTNEYEWKYEQSESSYMSKEYETTFHDYWFISVKPPYRRTKYAFIIESGTEKWLFGSRSVENLSTEPYKIKDLFNYFNFPFINPADIYTAPQWARETVWYEIFPDRFYNGNPDNDPESVLEWDSTEKVNNEMFFGGDIDGVIKKLDYLNELGISGIYFTPIFKSPTTHKYDTSDYFQVDPHFGSTETLKRLVQEAHQRGIRVMLDAVFNHCGYEHPFFQDVLKNGENSIYRDYFHIRKFPLFEINPEKFKFFNDKNLLNYDTFAFAPKLPKWNTENKQVKDYLLKVAEFWIKECDIDGWRLDVSNEVDHAFWRDFRKTCDEVKKDFFIVGENWDDSNPWLDKSQMHSIMNYDFMFALWNFLKGETDASGFQFDISKLLTNYPKHTSEVLFNIIDSHDTARIMTVCGDNKKLRELAFVFLLTFGGSPCIYYGDEISMSGGHDPDNRRCMIWDTDKQDLDTFRTIQKLIRLRKDHDALRAVDIRFIKTGKETNHVIYKKITADETLYIILNNDVRPVSLTIPEPEGTTFHDLYQDKEFDGIISLDSYGFRIIRVINK